MKRTREYALGTDDAEIVRLGLQHKLWSASAFALWERARISPGQTVLDVGCGPGYTSYDLAGVVTSKGKVIAIDESAHFINFLRNRLRTDPRTPIETHLGDVQKLDLRPRSVDAAYQRWVLCFVKDPEAVVRGVAGALKPGGVFAIQDYLDFEGFLLAPESKPITRFMTVSAEAWRERGGDPTIGLRLPRLLRKYGLRVADIRPLQRLGPPGSQIWTWPGIFFESYGPKLVGDGRLTRGEYRALVRDWKNRSADPTAFYCTPPMVEIIAVKDRAARK